MSFNAFHTVVDCIHFKYDGQRKLAKLTTPLAAVYRYVCHHHTFIGYNLLVYSSGSHCGKISQICTAPLYQVTAC